MFFRGFMKPENYPFPTVFIPENVGLGVTERPRLHREGLERVNMISPTGEGQQQFPFTCMEN